MSQAANSSSASAGDSSTNYFCQGIMIDRTTLMKWKSFQEHQHKALEDQIFTSPTNQCMDLSERHELLMQCCESFKDVTEIQEEVNHFEKMGKGSSYCIAMSGNSVLINKLKCHLSQFGQVKDVTLKGRASEELSKKDFHLWFVEGCVLRGGPLAASNVVMPQTPSNYSTQSGYAPDSDSDPATTDDKIRKKRFAAGRTTGKVHVHSGVVNTNMSCPPSPPKVRRLVHESDFVTTVSPSHKNLVHSGQRQCEKRPHDAGEHGRPRKIRMITDKRESLEEANRLSVHAGQMFPLQELETVNVPPKLREHMPVEGPVATVVDLSIPKEENLAKMCQRNLSALASVVSDRLSKISDEIECCTRELTQGCVNKRQLYRRLDRIAEHLDALNTD